MQELKLSFRRNGFLYSQLKRNEAIALYSVGGTYSNRTSYYEVCKIYIRKDKYGIRESLPSDEIFGRDLSRCFNNYNSALQYFDELTIRLNFLQGVPKVVTEVEEDIKVAA
jgi:hypothetical protein